MSIYEQFKENPFSEIIYVSTYIVVSFKFLGLFIIFFSYYRYPGHSGTLITHKNLLTFHNASN